ncbi:right-handed parallel beta-helix repeat-containing protein [Paenibacillus sp. CF384]|uniref:right-handed parallel beta-helix repeat-containing protein n=1 Tax=Paenibacillus sp. CF384 TaxID=1884382 RepID=UPI000894A7E4|nr:right-handed parallel beta-helix repeat-containing protein [Paenibacillus sp. CF384]SDX67475.1 Right handed beta helix region [Paenibacillus sp. CF384]
MELFVSVKDGDDANTGMTAEAAVRTLERARELVRMKLAEAYKQDITVWISGGRYELTEPLRLDERDSAADGYSVTYRGTAQDEEGVTISGGSAITGWEPYDDHTYRVRLNAGSAIHTLYENGERAWTARSPKQGYHVVAGRGDGDSRTGFRFHKEDVPRFEHGPGTQGAQIHIWPGEGEWNWFTETKTIDRISWEEGIVSFKEPAPWGIDQGSRYRVQGALSLLTEPGEYYFDAASGELYYYPRQLPIEEQVIAAPAMKRVIELVGSSPDTPVKGIVLEGLTVECSDYAQEYRMPDSNCEHLESRHGLVYLENACGISVRGCRLWNSGFSGIVLNGYCQGNEISDNLIEHTGYNGVYVIGIAPGEGDYDSAEQADVSKGNLITNNLIRFGGELIGHSSGIQLYQSGSNEVSHNEIHGMPRYGISLKGLRQGAMESSYYGTEVTWENHWDFTHTRNNLITRNNFWDVMKDSQDGGMLESWGAGTGNRIIANRFHHSGIYFSFGFCIYLDDASDHYHVSHNVIHDLYSAGSGVLWFVVFSKGIGNRIENNLLVRNDARAAFGTQEMAGEENRDITILRNLAVSSGDQLYHFVNWKDDRLLEADFNLYDNGTKELTVSGIYGDDKRGLVPIPWEAWRNMVDGKFDAHTLNADAMLITEGEGGHVQFTLDPASPAFGLGWEAIDMSSMGLKETFPFPRG